MVGGLFQPNVPSQEYIVQLVRCQYQIWREENEAREPKWKPENIRFEHDPLWRNRLLSIQCAHDGNILFWKLARVAYIAGAAAPYVISLIQ